MLNVRCKCHSDGPVVAVIELFCFSPPRPMSSKQLRGGREETRNQGRTPKREAKQGEESREGRDRKGGGEKGGDREPKKGDIRKRGER